MKLLFISPEYKTDGIAVYSKEVFKHLKNIPDIQLTNSDYSVSKSLIDKNDIIHIQHHYSYFGKPYPFFNKFRSYINDINKPVIVTVHDLITEAPDEVPFLFKPLVTLLIRILNRQTFLNSKINHYIVHAKKQKEILVKMGLSSGKISVLPMGIPENRSSSKTKSASSIKQKWDFSGKIVLTILGFIYRRKGYIVAIEALKVLKDNKVVLLIAGDTNPRTTVDKGYKQELVNLIKENGLTNNVIITGYLDDTEFAEVVKITDIIVAPFFANFGSPYSLATAIGFRKPIIASDIEPVREVFSRGECMDLFKAGNADDLANKINNLLRTPKRLKKLAKETTNYARKYSFSNLAINHQKIYHLILNNSVHLTRRENN